MIGVVVPVHDGARFLDEALAGIAAQTCADLACVVVDDGSTDASAELVSAWVAQDDRFSLVRQAHAGVAAARNAGYAHLPRAADLVAFHDADDVWLPDALEALADALRAAPGCVGVHALAEVVDETGVVVEPGRWPAFQRERWALRDRRYERVGPEVPTTLDVAFAAWRGYPASTCLFRRDVADRLGGFDPSFAVSEDWEYVLRACRFGPLRPLDRVVAHYRRHAGNTTGAAVEPAALRAVRLLRTKAFHSGQNDPATAELLRRAWRALQRHEVEARAAEVAGHLRSGRPGPAAVQALRLGLHAAHVARGRPVPVGARQLLEDLFARRRR